MVGVLCALCTAVPVLAEEAENIGSQVLTEEAENIASQVLTEETENTASQVLAEETENTAMQSLIESEGTESSDSVGQDIAAPLVLEDGGLQPMLQWSDLREADYTNENSDILRFCVYVETDYDTDADGMNDLVKVLIQVPRAAAEGQYQAGTIYDPTPYGAGTLESNPATAEYDYSTLDFDYEKLYQQGQKRTPEGEMNTIDAAMNADPNDWNYAVPWSEDGHVGFSYSKMYDYYLVRGFAVVECSGIGTYGSEGFELCGMDLERDSHKAVIEWLTGDRTAYTDPWSGIEIKADWSNGKVAMTGASYGGTLPFSVAVTGVKGLETIIPFAGIADWYDYTNSQGVPIINEVHYADSLAGFVCLGTYLDKDVLVPSEDYPQWLMRIAKDQDDTNGDYAPVWEMLDYSHHYENLKCSALLVTGLNDYNVTTKHFDRMYHAFKNAGMNVKGVLHQDGHNILSGMMVNGELWDELMNRWLTHYLYGVENGIENMPEMTVQSNLDGSFTTYDSWGTEPYSDCDVFSDEEESVISSKGLASFVKQYTDDYGVNLESSNYQDAFYMSLSNRNVAFYPIDLPDNETICGVPEVHLKMKTEDTQWDGLMVSAVLIDVDEDGKPFYAYMTKDEIGKVLPTKVIGKYDVGGGAGKNNVLEYIQTPTYGKCISYGWTDLCNPGMGYDSREYVYQEDIEENQYYDYTFYMLPTSYTLQEGHELILALMTWDPFRAFLDQDFDINLEENPDISQYDYSYTVDNQSINVRLPLAQ